jgi:uncharacterized protein (DUF1810 family)
MVCGRWRDKNKPGLALKKDVPRSLSHYFFRNYLALLSKMESNLQKFLDAQEHIYAQALAEIKAGRKTGHWMWFIFPQVADLGQSPTSVYYAIRDYKAAEEYLQHPVLGGRLHEICEVLFSLPETSAEAIFGKTDAMKLRSCLTLFSLADDSDSQIFSRLLEKYFYDYPNQRTIELLSS